MAGGRSTRIGFDKRKIDFKGKPLIQWSLDVLARVSDEMIISLAPDEDPDYFFGLLSSPFKIVLDESYQKGPIYGLLHSFRKAKGEYVAVAPSDSPFITPEFYNFLFDKSKGHDAVIPKVNGYWEPLLAVYHRERMIQAIETTIEEGRSKVIDAYSKLIICEISREMLESHGFNLKTLTNINFSSDLEHAKNNEKQ